jgi:hypothetical protein
MLRERQPEISPGSSWTRTSWADQTSRILGVSSRAPTV